MSRVPPPPPRLGQQAPPPAAGPIGTVANVLGLCAAGIALFTPAIAFAPLGALGAAAFLLGITAGNRESKAGGLGVVGGLVGVIAALVLYNQYHEALDAIDQLGQLGL